MLSVPEDEDEERMVALPAPAASPGYVPILHAEPASSSSSRDVPPERDDPPRRDAEDADHWIMSDDGQTVTRHHAVSRQALFISEDTDCPIDTDHLADTRTSTILPIGGADADCIEDDWRAEGGGRSLGFKWKGKTVFTKIEAQPVVELDGRDRCRTEAEWRADALSLGHRMTHLPKNPYCAHCQRARMENARVFRGRPSRLKWKKTL